MSYWYLKGKSFKCSNCRNKINIINSSELPLICPKCSSEMEEYYYDVTLYKSEISRLKAIKSHIGDKKYKDGTCKKQELGYKL